MPQVRRRFAQLAVVAVAATLLTPVGSAGAAVTLPPGFDEVTVASGGMSTPVGVTWAPDGRAFVAQKGGAVKVIRADGSVVSTPLIDLSAKVNSYSDRGLLGIATDTDFATNHWLYLLYVVELQPGTPDTDAPMVSRLTRVTVNDDNTLVNPASPETVILGTVGSAPCPIPPSNTVDCIPADYKWHTIGTVRSDPTDGTLWVGTGDTHAHALDATSFRPFDENSYAGKILHIDRQGRGLPGHPFCPTDSDLTHVCTKIYAKGFRNPFRFHLRPGKGPVVGDVGHSLQEELDLIQPGKNYGWPCYEGTAKDPIYDDTPTCIDLYAKAGTAAGATPPAWTYPHADGASITAGPVYTGTSYPVDWQGDVFVGDYVQGWVKRLDVNAADQVTAAHDFATGLQGNTDLEPYPANGDITYVDLGYPVSPGAIRRFRYTPGNAPPVARASAAPAFGEPPLQVSFTGSTSSDSDNDELTFDWDFGDGSAHATVADPVHTYGTQGVYTATLTVDDGQGHSDSDSVTVNVGVNAPPSPTILSPAAGAKYRGGEEVILTGSGTDLEDGTLAGSALGWEVLLHHATHIHPIAAFTGASGSFVPLADHDADSHYEIRLTATDSGGATTTVTRRVDPETVSLQLVTTPPGIALTYGDDVPAVTPTTRVAAVGTQTTISAPGSVLYEGRTYTFSHWSDGGTRQHSYTVPSVPTTLRATYTSGGPTTLVIPAEADVYVDESQPTAAKGTSSGLIVDGSPQVQSFLRFRVSGTSGRPVTRVRLRMYQTGDSSNGGVIRSSSNTTWPEGTTTWENRPAIDGAQRGSFPSVAAEQWYEATLDPATVVGDGPVTLALTTPISDGIRWASRTTTNPPQLLVDLASGSDEPITQVAASTAGSADPTAFAGQHRVVITAGGRELVVRGRNPGGVQLTWRSPGGAWQTGSLGDVVDGGLEVGTTSLELVSSIALAREPSGAESAWVVWSAAKPSSSTPRPVRMRKLTDLDAAGGPTVGPVVTVAAPALGAWKADLAFEKAPDGTFRGAVVYSRTTSSTVHDVVAVWFTDLTSPTPAFVSPVALVTDNSNGRHGSLVSTTTGLRVVARGITGTLRVHSHAASAALTSWVRSANGGSISSAAVPSGVGLSSGHLLVAGENATSVVTVKRFTASGGTVTTEVSLTGYRQPTLATDGTRAWLVMVRVKDGYVVSRAYTATGGWATTDTVEVGVSGGGNHAWPAVLTTATSGLRLVVRGPSGGAAAAAVLHLRRPV